MTPRLPRRAFTLVELLVVASIMLVLFGLILVGARPGTSSQLRQGAQLVAAALVSAQTRGLGNPAGAAVIFEPADAGGAACTAVSNGDMPPLITGTTGTSGIPPSPRSASVATISLTPTNADPEDLLSAYKIRFGGQAPRPVQPMSPWLSLSCASAASGGGVGTVTLRSANGQTNLNSVWPDPTVSVTGTNPFDFIAARYPNRGERAAPLPKAAAIDLRFSGVGDDPATTWGGLAGKGEIGVCFDSVGGVDAIMQQVLKTGSRVGDAQPIDPAEPLYLLVAARADIDGGANTLADPAAFWVVVHPQTGRVSIGGNQPQQGTDVDAVRAARASARALVLGGK